MPEVAGQGRCCQTQSEETRRRILGHIRTDRAVVAEERDYVQAMRAEAQAP